MERNYYILYVGAILFSLFSCFNSYYLSNIIGCILTLIFSYLGIWIYNKNKLISTVQFILCGILSFLMLGFSIFSNISSILFILLGIMIIIEYNKERKNSNEEINTNKSKKYWLIPIATLFIVMLLFLTASSLEYSSTYSVTYDIGTEKSDTPVIELNDITYSFGGTNFVSGEINGTITSNEFKSGLKVDINFYDSNNKLMDSDNDYRLQNISIKPGNKYIFDVSYYNQTRADKPYSAEIDIYDGTGHLLHSEEIMF